MTSVLSDLIGDYKLYKTEEDDEDDGIYVSQQLMQRRIVDRFGRSKMSFQEALQAEDYEEEGIIDLVQLKETIVAYDEEIESDLVDYALFYVFARSSSPDRMEYPVLIKLVADGLEQKQRVQSAQKKNRPESSSPEKLKQRNPDMQQKAAAEI